MRLVAVRIAWTRESRLISTPPVCDENRAGVSHGSPSLTCRPPCLTPPSALFPRTIQRRQVGERHRDAESFTIVSAAIEALELLIRRAGRSRDVRACA